MYEKIGKLYTVHTLAIFICDNENLRTTVSPDKIYHQLNLTFAIPTFVCYSGENLRKLCDVDLVEIGADQTIYKRGGKK